MSDKKVPMEAKEKKVCVLTDEDVIHLDASMNYNDTLLRKLAKL